MWCQSSFQCLFLKNNFLALFVLKQFKTWAAPFIWESNAGVMVKIQIVPKGMEWKLGLSLRVLSVLPWRLMVCCGPFLPVQGTPFTTHMLSHSTSVGRHCKHVHAVLFTWPYLYMLLILWCTLNTRVFYHISVNYSASSLLMDII